MFIYYSGFWNGFHTNQDPVNETFFNKLLTMVFNKHIRSTKDIYNADILIESIFTDTPVIQSKAWKYSILFSGESRITANTDLYSVVLWIKNDYLKYIALPLFIPYLECNNLDNTIRSTRSINIVPSKMVCAIISNPCGQVRNTFIDLLEARGVHVINGGSYKNTLGYTIPGPYNSKYMIDFISQYKFVISMENSYGEYYISEKIIHGFVAGTVPIYWGTDKVFEYFNKERFLYLKDDNAESINTIIDYMVNITDQQYLEIVNKKVLIKDNLLDPIIESIQKVFISNEI